ncbi:MAG: hypothetical protein QME51_06715 [Planctomycetota bacterium]|nr:hypothetical protein [Planctomycetota bacterium]MDI6788045.1 hypothetical protein [Planctomycetota bacterium]
MNNQPFSNRKPASKPQGTAFPGKNPQPPPVAQRYPQPQRHAPTRPVGQPVRPVGRQPGIPQRQSSLRGKPVTTNSRQVNYRREEPEPETPEGNKKKNLLFIGGGIGLVVIIIIAFVLSAGSTQKAREESKREIEMLDSANKLFKDREYDLALEKYQKFLKEFRGSKYVSEVKDSIKKIEKQKGKEQESRRLLNDLIQKKKDYPTKDYPELLKEYESFVKEYEDTSVIQDARNEMRVIKRIVASSRTEEESYLFNETRALVNNLRKKKDYDAAIEKWKMFRKENPSLNERQRKMIEDDIEEIRKEKEKNSEKK